MARVRFDYWSFGGFLLLFAAFGGGYEVRFQRLQQENVELRQQVRHTRLEVDACDAWINGQFQMFVEQKLQTCRALETLESPLVDELRDCQEAIWRNDFRAYEPWLKANREDNARIWGP
jgi:hypothetical protein